MSFRTFGSASPQTHRNPIRLCFLFFFPQVAWRRDVKKKSTFHKYMTCHKTVDCGHAQSSAPHPFWRGCPILWPRHCRCWHVESLLCGVWEVDQKGVTEAELPRGQNHLFTQFSSVSGFESSALLSPSAFWHSPDSSGGHFRSRTLALSLRLSVSVSFPFPWAVTDPCAWKLLEGGRGGRQLQITKFKSYQT